MTLDEWNDEVARMTPRQREAMGYAMLASRSMAQRAEIKATETGEITVWEYQRGDLESELFCHESGYARGQVDFHLRECAQ